MTELQVQRVAILRLRAALKGLLKEYCFLIQEEFSASPDLDPLVIAAQAALEGTAEMAAGHSITIEAKDVGAFLNELARIWRERASKALVMVGGKDD